MNHSTSRLEARAFCDRWKLVNDMERKELRSTPMETKFNQMEVMLTIARELNWETKLAAEDNQARQNWEKLRKRYQQKHHG